MRSPKGKIISWIVFMILIIGAFGLLLFLQKDKAPTEVKEEVVTSTETTKEEAKTKPKKTFATPDLSAEEKKEQDNKAYQDALLSGEGCEEIEHNEELQQLCFDTMNYGTALQKKDEKLCEEIKDKVLKEKCCDSIYLGLATENSDESLCEKIKNPGIKQSCLDQIRSLFGRTAKSADSCEQIQDSALKQNCLDNFYFAASNESTDEESCDVIKDGDLKERCTKTVAKNIEIAEITKTQITRTYQTAEEKITTCETNECKNEANFNLALEKKDLSYCNLITDVDMQANCIKTQSATINSYYLKQATSLKDPSLCTKILDEVLRQTCLTYAQ